MPWDPFLMKKLIKNEICGSINSARIQCSLEKVNIYGYCSLNSSRIPPKTRERKKKMLVDFSKKIYIYISIYIYETVWIGLILLKLKTYCWNYCSKIIFKYVNNTEGPIFNEKIDKKWNLWVHKQCTDALFTEKSQHLRLLFIEQ